MIEANELRIGNWVSGTEDYANYPLLIKVVGINNDSVSLFAPEDRSGELITFEWDYENIFPIPLSPEILERCGLERTGNLANSAQRKFFRRGRLIFEILPEDRIAFYIDSKIESPLICFVDYLHQLQNLYFALTGEELEIKEMQTANK